MLGTGSGRLAGNTWGSERTSFKIGYNNLPDRTCVSFRNISGSNAEISRAGEWTIAGVINQGYFSGWLYDVKGSAKFTPPIVNYNQAINVSIIPSYRAVNMWRRTA